MKMIIWGDEPIEMLNSASFELYITASRMNSWRPKKLSQNQPIIMCWSEKTYFILMSLEKNKIVPVFDKKDNNMLR